MNWGTLSSNDKLAVYGSAAVIIGGLLSFGLGLGWLAVLAAIAMLVVVFLPSMQPQTTLPGSKGSLMLICGGVAAAVALLGLVMVLPVIGYIFGGYLGFGANPLAGIMFFVSVAGALLMGWAGWQAFQGEGGKFQVGAGGSGAGGSTSPTSGSTGGTTGASAGGGTMASTTGAGTTTTTGSTPMTSGTAGTTGTTDSYGSTGSTGTTGAAGTTGTTGTSDSYGSTGTTGTTGSDPDNRTTP